MAEPLKNTSALDDGAPRTARARSERDLGNRPKRPQRGQRSARKPSSQESRSESRPSSSERPRQPKSSSRPPKTKSTRSGSPQRPRNVKAGNGARILAPLALILFAIACFVVITSQDSGSSAKDSSAKAAAVKAAAVKASGPTRSVYRVKAGDSFTVIAETQGIDAAKLQELNPDVDPRAIQPGQKLKLK
jgi:LysM repeat protein